MKALNLTRKLFETIVIEGGIEITVVEIKKRSESDLSGRVVLRISAPGKQVYRKELAEKDPDIFNRKGRV